MLKNIHVKGFKCIDNSELELKNLNLLTGRNSSGKSTLIQAVLLGLQEYDKVKYNNPLNNRYVELGEFNDVKNLITGSKQIDIDMLLSTGEKIENSIYVDDEDKVILKRTPEQEQLPKVLYVSANRIGVLDFYQKNLTDLTQIGIHCEYAFDYLSKNKESKIIEDFIKDKTTVPTLGHQVNYWLNYIMNYDVIADIIEDINVIRVRYASIKNRKPTRPQHVGTGVSYIAEIIIAALSCQKGDVLIIENPEIHLHPKAQSKTIEFLAFLASKGLQIIVETHSDHIYNGLRKSIHNKQIDVEQCQIYFFEKDENEISSATKIKINENGTIENPVDGLFDQFDEDLDELLDW